MEKDEETPGNKKANEKIFLLTNIFHSMLPLVSSPNEIHVLFSFLNYNEENTTNENIYYTIKTKIELLHYLMELFKMNNNLIYLFIKKCKSNFKSFFDPLIDIYLNEYTQDNYKIIIEEFLELLIKYVSIQKNTLEYIYQKISIYFRKDAKRKLTENLLLKYLNILDIYYTCSLKDNTSNEIIENCSTNNNNNNNLETATDVEDIKNFIYLNGLNNKVSLILNNSSTNVNTDFPTLEYGFTFIFWLNLNQSLIESFFVLHKNDEQSINLINIIYGGHQIKLQLINIEYLILIVDDNIKSNLINFTTKFKYNEWNSFCLVLYPKKAAISSLVKTTSIKLHINNNMFNVIVNYPKNFTYPLEEKINSITLFENLIGKITSILFFSYAIEEDKIKSFFSSMEEQGFYKLKFLYKFLLANDKEYSQFSKNYKYYESFKNKISKLPKIIDIGTKDQNIKNLM